MIHGGRDDVNRLASSPCSSDPALDCKREGIGAIQCKYDLFRVGGADERAQIGSAGVHAISGGYDLGIGGPARAGLDTACPCLHRHGHGGGLGEARRGIVKIPA